MTSEKLHVPTHVAPFTHKYDITQKCSHSVLPLWNINWRKNLQRGWKPWSGLFSGLTSLQDTKGIGPPLVRPSPFQPGEHYFSSAAAGPPELITSSLPKRSLAWPQTDSDFQKSRGKRWSGHSPPPLSSLARLWNEITSLVVVIDVRVAIVGRRKSVETWSNGTQQIASFQKTLN